MINAISANGFVSGPTLHSMSFCPSPSSNERSRERESGIKSLLPRKKKCGMAGRVTGVFGSRTDAIVLDDEEAAIVKLIFGALFGCWFSSGLATAFAREEHTHQEESTVLRSPSGSGPRPPSSHFVGNRILPLETYGISALGSVRQRLRRRAICRSLAPSYGNCGSISTACKQRVCQRVSGRLRRNRTVEPVSVGCIELLSNEIRTSIFAQSNRSPQQAGKEFWKYLFGGRDFS